MDRSVARDITRRIIENSDDPDTSQLIADAHDNGVARALGYLWPDYIELIQTRWAENESSGSN